MSVSCGCCVLSGTGLWVRLITPPEESYRLWCVSECDREASTMRRPWPTGALASWEKYIYIYIYMCVCVCVCVCMYICTYMCIHISVQYNPQLTF
jgi:hypothetical protein